MMRALEAGGLEAIARKSREDFRQKFKDDVYDPNEGGLYELDPSDATDEFPAQFKGKLIKVLMPGLDRISVMPKIKMVFMRRDTEEIRQSYQAFFGKSFELDDKEFTPRMNKAIENLANRKDVELTVLWYKDVIAHPEQTFSDLAASGWPIDPEKAAAVVNPELYRFRRENLELGIK